MFDEHVELGGRVHADRAGAVVFCDGDTATKARFQPGPGAATDAEEVHDYLIVLLVEAKAVLGFEIERKFLPLCGYMGSSRV